MSADWILVARREAAKLLGIEWGLRTRIQGPQSRTDSFCAAPPDRILHMTEKQTSRGFWDALNAAMQGKACLPCVAGKNERLIDADSAGQDITEIGEPFHSSVGKSSERSHEAPACDASQETLSIYHSRS